MAARRPRMIERHPILFGLVIVVPYWALMTWIMWVRLN
jgi:hypothetical protein